MLSITVVTWIINVSLIKLNKPARRSEKFCFAKAYTNIWLVYFFFYLILFSLNNYYSLLKWINEWIWIMNKWINECWKAWVFVAWGFCRRLSRKKLYNCRRTKLGGLQIVIIIVNNYSLAIILFILNNY